MFSSTFCVESWSNYSIFKARCFSQLYPNPAARRSVPQPVDGWRGVADLCRVSGLMLGCPQNASKALSASDERIMDLELYRRCMLIIIVLCVRNSWKDSGRPL